MALRRTSGDGLCRIRCSGTPRTRQERSVEDSARRKKVGVPRGNSAPGHHSKGRMQTNTLAPRTGGPRVEPQSQHEPRYQIYRQALAGNFLPEFKTDSPVEAVEMFALIAPAFDGGAI